MMKLFLDQLILYLTEPTFNDTEKEAFLTLTQRQILLSSKRKEVADDNFKFDENGRKFSKWVENTVGKGEIAHNEQFLLFAQCFQKTSTADT